MVGDSLFVTPLDSSLKNYEAHESCIKILTKIGYILPSLDQQCSSSPVFHLGMVNSIQFNSIQFNSIFFNSIQFNSTLFP